MTEPVRRSNRQTAMFIRRTVLVTALAAVMAACAGSPAPTPEITPRPTPTPIGASVTNPQEAAALVIASDPRFEGAMEYSADIIGASKYWISSPLPSGGYRIELTIGWGDCPAGCSNRHVWTYDVAPDGALTLVEETGDPVPNDLPA